MRTARGVYDYDSNKQERINYICNMIKFIAKQFGAKEIDTPILELSSLLLNKYGDEAETKLIYKIEKYDDKTNDNSDEKEALRYDLTVPFVRYIMMNGIEKFKRIQIGKVFRKDKPYPKSGRYCEFIQGDFDIVGQYNEMVSESEIIKLITLILYRLKIDNYEIKINFRQNLEKIVEMSGVNKKMFKSICTSIDKLDKYDWTYIENELLDKKLDKNQIDKLKKFLNNNYLDDSIKNQYDTLMKYCEILDCNNNIKFDATLARGLDYYTGLIYEVVLKDNKITDDVKIGTIIAGGRYDKMIYKMKKNSRVYIPAIGVSFGVNRLELCMRDIIVKSNIKIMIVGEQKYFEEKLKIMNILLNKPFIVEYFDEQKKNVNQINYSIKNNYDYIIIYGEDGTNNVKVKKNDQSQDIICNIDNMLDFII